MLLQKSTEKILLDTNALLRYILNDNEEMSRIASELIDGTVYTLPEVLAEVAYVLAKVYKANRADIATFLSAIVNDVDVEPAHVVEKAIEVYRDNNLDFVDCMLVAYNKIEGTKVFTFDKKMNKLLDSK